MNNIGLFYYDLANINNDIIDQVAGLLVGGINANTLVATIPGQFWIENDVNGTAKLCTTKVVGQPLDLTLNMGTPNMYVATPKPFVPVPDYSGVIGPHPTVIYKPGSTK